MRKRDPEQEERRSPDGRDVAMDERRNRKRRGRLGIRAQLFLVAFGLITLSVAVAYVYARAEIERDATERIRTDLIVRAHLVAERAAVARYAPDDVAAWDALADELGERAGGRVTFIDHAGKVVGDSQVAVADIPSLQNHRLRSEVVAALEAKSGQSQRYSTTTERQMIYVALTVPEGPLAVVRVGLAQAELESAVRPLRQVLVVSAVLALSVMLVASLAVQVASRKARVLADTARKMAAGDLEVRSRLVGDDEFTEVGNALDRLAKNLSRTLEALSEERDRMRGVLESMQEGVLLLDEEGRVALINPALREMLLLRGDEIGQTLLAAVRNAELKELVDRVVESGELVTGEVSLSGLRPRQLLVRASPMQGDRPGVLAVFVDVTETRRLENIRREFVANVSHELRTPVTSIRSAAETLQAALESRPDMAARFLDIIERNAARLHELVEDLLDLSRIESRQFSLSLESIEPEGVLRQVTELFTERAERRGVALDWTVEPDAGLLVADRKALERVLANLIDNAIKYGGEGRVSVAARRHGDRVALSVQDDGPGIEERHLQRLFERFYRVDAGRSRDLGGTGLGLSIVKHLVDSMGGTVQVESAVGQGTTFTVLLPRREPSSLPPR